MYCEVTVGFIAQLPDNQLSGSSQWDNFHGYERSRLHTMSDGGYTGAWVSGSYSIGQFIQADLGTVRRVEKIATQGRDNYYDQWVTSYKFAYSADGITYSYILNLDGSERVFTGNNDRNTVVEHVLDTAVAARYVRAHPQTWREAMSMRWEVYGCDIGKILLTLPTSVCSLPLKTASNSV